MPDLDLEAINAEVDDPEEGNETELSEGVEADASEGGVEASPEDAPQAEETSNQPDGSGESVEAPGEDVFSRLVGALGDVPETVDPELLKRIKVEDIERLPPELKGLLQLQISILRKGYADKESPLSEREQKLAEREQQLNQAARNLVTQRAQWMRTLKSAEFQKFLDEAKNIDTENLDPLSPEAQDARIKKGVAEHFQKAFAPLEQEAQRAERVARWEAFQDAHPELKTDKSLVKDLAGRVKALKASGRESVSETEMETILKAIKHDRIAAQNEQRRARERQARAASARRSAVTTASNKRVVTHDLSAVRRNGYKGERGYRALALYLEDHPEAARKSAS